jgi:acetate kinase
MTVQSGVFHGSRVGDFDAFAILKLQEAGLGLEEIWRTLGKEAGLAGLSGVSSDMREVQEAAASGHADAKLAVEAFVESIRHYVGAYLAVLGGADAICFTGGIGQHDAIVREGVCAGLGFAGFELDRQRNASAPGDEETRIDAGAETGSAGGAIWVLPTNEELIVARQTLEVLRGAAGE